MRLKEFRFYHSVNEFAVAPVVRMTLDLGALEGWSVSRLGAEFAEALLEHVPGLASDELATELHSQSCSVAYVLERVAVVLQRIAGSDVSFGVTRPREEAGIYDVCYEHEHPEVARLAARLAVVLIAKLLPPRLRPWDTPVSGIDFESEQRSFVRRAKRLLPDGSARLLLEAALARDIPWSRISDNSPFIRLGQGRFQKKIFGATTEDTSFIAAQWSNNKLATSDALRDLGIPVPEQRVVRNSLEAVRAADSLGWPVVVKPNAANFSRGVRVGLSEPRQVRNAFNAAREHGSVILVQKHIPGEVYRVLVLDGTVIAVHQRIVAHVIGDGKQSIEALIEASNEHLRDRRRLEYDAEARALVAQLGYTHESVPDEGEIVRLRELPRPRTGSRVDVTDVAHADNRRLAERAATTLGVDVAGVDIIMPDIARSHRDVGGAILEINYTPAVTSHVRAEGTPRDVVGAILNKLYPPGSPGRVLTALITGTETTARVAARLAGILAEAGHRVGLGTGEGVWIDGEQTAGSGLTSVQLARAVLFDPTIDAAVLEASPQSVLDHGLGCDACDVAGVLGGASSSGDAKLQSICRTIASLARRGVTVDVTHDLGREMADSLKDVSVYPVGSDREETLALVSIPAKQDTSHEHGFEVMFAAVMAHGLGVDAEKIERSLRRLESCPGP